MAEKLIIYFGNKSAAKSFAERAKKLPYVTYATDYLRSNDNAVVMVCGEFTEEQAAKLKSKKI